MTRDEAIALRIDAYHGGSEYRFKMASRDVDDWAALGMLRLDESPRAPDTVLAGVLTSAGLQGLQRRAVIDGIYAAGLKIVEK